MQNDHARDDRLAALQSRIRQAGRAAGWLKRGLLVALLGGVVALACRLGTAAADTQQERRIQAEIRLYGRSLRGCGNVWSEAWEGATLWGVVLGSPLAIAGSLLLTSLYCGLRRRDLGLALRRLSRDEQKELLARLRDDPGRETQQIVGPLLAELGRQQEVTPAAAPAGTGAEVSAGEPPGECGRSKRCDLQARRQRVPGWRCRRCAGGGRRRGGGA